MSTVAFAPSKTSKFEILQPETTHSGSPIRRIQKGLPKITTSLCPECTEKIEAVLFEEDGKVIMEKTCPQHGEFRDVIYSDVKLYLKMEEWTFGDNRGVENPAIPEATECPDQCGLCSMHTSHTVLANVDLTNRCNLTCPVCFANANTAGYLYEPDLEGVRTMLQALRDERPVAGRVVQFSGGEPTIHPRFFDILRMAAEMGFSHIQAATNGLMFTNLEFAIQAKEAGLHTLYLQFDGVSVGVSSPRMELMSRENGVTQLSGNQSFTGSQMPVCSMTECAKSDCVKRFSSSSEREMRPQKLTGWKLMALTTSMFSIARRMMSPIW